MPKLTDWIAAETRFATDAMLAAVSATHLVTERRGLGQRVVPRPGSVLASPVPAHYDPDPDYFFHWFRDSALVIDALRVALLEGDAEPAAVGRLGEFVRFSRELGSLDGRAFLAQVTWRSGVQPAFLQFLRPEEEIAALSGESLRADVRVNADGTPDLIRWSRPQTDGPALRSLALMRWWPLLADAQLREDASEVIDGDLAFVLSHTREPSFDIWEERNGHHYYTQLLGAEALRIGAAWLEEAGQAMRAQHCRAAADALISRLDALWSTAAGHYRASDAMPAADGSRELDIAVVLGALHTDRVRGRHSVLDPRTQATLAALEQLFEAEYAINRQLPEGLAPAMGRYPNDRYYSGGAYYFATLAAAEFHFRLADTLNTGEPLVTAAENQEFLNRLGCPAASGDGRAVAARALERGDAFMRTVQRFTPANGELAEQFDRTSGEQTSARRLSWSYAAFITAAAARAQACRSRPPPAAATPPAGTA